MRRTALDPLCLRTTKVMELVPFRRDKVRGSSMSSEILAT